MRIQEAWNTRSLTVHDTINTESYWATLEPLLEERGIEPLDHIGVTLQRWARVINDMPDSLFNPLGDEASPLRETHWLLNSVVNAPIQPYTLTVAKAIYPYWSRQLADARDYLGTV